MFKMKYYFLSYYVYDIKTELWQYKDRKVSSKELAEFIIENAYNSQIKILHIKEEGK